MQIVAIETSNFKGLSGYRDFADIPQGIVGITGDNGKGKSTLMSAVAYALYGPEVLDTGNADVVTWGEKESYVNVWFAFDKHTYMLHRRTTGKETKARLEREGEPIAQSATEVTAVVTELLGIDRVGFLASVFSKQEDLLGIGSLQPAKRATTVLRLLQLDKIDVALKNLSETNRDLNKEIAMLRSVPQPLVNTDYKDAIDRAKSRIQGLAAQREDYQKGIDAETTIIRSLEAKVADYNDYAGKANVLNGIVAAAKDTVRESLDQVDRLTLTEPAKPDPWIEPDEYLSMVREYDDLTAALAAAICPTCKRPYDREDSIEIELRRETISKRVTKWEPAYENVKRYQAALSAYERSEDQRKAAQERAENALGRLESAREELEALPKVENPQKPYNAALQKRRELEANLSGTNGMLATEDNDIKHWTEAMNRYESEKRHYAETADRIKTLENQILINGQTELLMKQYKSSLIARVIPTITERASGLITEMTEGRYTELSLTPQYDIEYRNDNGDLKSFANLSGGEKDVFALALRLAIADLKAGSIGMLVLDEVLESLDPGRQEATWAALERLTSRYSQIFVITHVDTFKDRAPCTISV